MIIQFKGSLQRSGVCAALMLQSAQKSQVMAFGDKGGGGGWGLSHSVAVRVDGARRSKGARGVQEETVEAWVGPWDMYWVDVEWQHKPN